MIDEAIVAPAGVSPLSCKRRSPASARIGEQSSLDNHNRRRSRPQGRPADGGGERRRMSAHVRLVGGASSGRVAPGGRAARPRHSAELVGGRARRPAGSPARMAVASASARSSAGRRSGMIASTRAWGRFRQPPACRRHGLVGPWRRAPSDEHASRASIEEPGTRLARDRPSAPRSRVGLLARDLRDRVRPSDERLEARSRERPATSTKRRVAGPRAVERRTAPIAADVARRCKEPRAHGRWRSPRARPASHAPRRRSRASSRSALMAISPARAGQRSGDKRHRNRGQSGRHASHVRRKPIAQRPR